MLLAKYSNRTNIHSDRNMPDDYFEQKDYEDLQARLNSLESRKTFVRNRSRLLVGVSVVGIIFLIIASIILNYLKIIDNIKLIIMIFILIILGVIFGLLVYFEYLNIQQNIQFEIGSYTAKKNALEKRKANASSPAIPYYDRLVEINLDNLEKYYKLIKVHTDNSYMVSLLTGIIGFILISLGLVGGYFNRDESIIIYISTASGIIMEFISGIFFYLYNRTIRELKDYHERLLQVQNILLAFKIVDDTHDDKEKVKMLEQMLTCLTRTEPLKDIVSTTNEEGKK